MKSATPSAAMTYSIPQPMGVQTLINHTPAGTDFEVQAADGQTRQIHLDPDSTIDVALNILLFHTQSGGMLSRYEDLVNALIQSYYSPAAPAI